MTTLARRLQPTDRKAAILQAAVSLASTKGYAAVNNLAVSQAANVSPGLVLRYFYSTDELRKQVAAEAIRLEVLPVIAEMIICRAVLPDEVPAELRMKAFESIA